MSSRTYLSIGDVLTLCVRSSPTSRSRRSASSRARGWSTRSARPSGYRKFFDHDVERLRWVLRQQREHFLPLKVIRDRLDSGELDDSAGRTANGKPSPGAGDGAPRPPRRWPPPKGRVQPTKADEEAMARILADASRRTARLPEAAQAPPRACRSWGKQSARRGGRRQHRSRPRRSAPSGATGGSRRRRPGTVPAAAVAAGPGRHGPGRARAAARQAAPERAAPPPSTPRRHVTAPPKRPAPPRHRPHPPRRARRPGRGRCRPRPRQHGHRRQPHRPGALRRLGLSVEEVAGLEGFGLIFRCGGRVWRPTTRRP